MTPDRFTHHVSVLGVDQVLEMFEQASTGTTPPVPQEVAHVAGRYAGVTTRQVPALEGSAPVPGPTTVVLLGAERELIVDGEAERLHLVPGDVLVLGPGTAAAVVPSDDAHDEAVLLLLG